MAIEIEVALYLVAAAIVAAAIRLMDTPKSLILKDDGQIDWSVVIPPVVGAMIAVPIGCWLMGVDVTAQEGFVTAVAFGIAGLALVKGLLNLKDDLVTVYRYLDCVEKRRKPIRREFNIDHCANYLSYSALGHSYLLS